jgi:hypothetical protein
MIVFRGELSDASKLYLRKKLGILNGCGIMGVAVGLGAPMLALGIIWNLWIIAIPVICTTSLICILLAIPKTNPQEKNIEANTPSRVKIDGSLIELEGKVLYARRDVSDVKVVYDEGSLYRIVFYLGYKCIGAICQKDLIVEGSIEEFEDIFKDKIRKKY